ncbi:MAG: MerR family transcriptional regulator [Chloroflexota bacterium]
MPPSESVTFSIAELAARTELTPRTIRYYVAQSLLPVPNGRGQRRLYTREHLLRLESIKRLKANYLPLSEIRRALTGLSLVELEQISAGPTLTTEAIGHFQSRTPEQSSNFQARTPEQASSFGSASAGPLRAQFGFAGETHRDVHPSAVDIKLEVPWRRVTLAPGIELHYQLTGEAEREAIIGRLIRAAAALL